MNQNDVDFFKREFPQFRLFSWYKEDELIRLFSHVKEITESVSGMKWSCGLMMLFILLNKAWFYWFSPPYISRSTFDLHQNILLASIAFFVPAVCYFLYKMFRNTKASLKIFEAPHSNSSIEDKFHLLMEMNMITESHYGHTFRAFGYKDNRAILKMRAVQMDEEIKAEER